MKERVAMKNIVVDVQYIQAEFQNKRFSEKELLLNAQASSPCWMNDLRRRILRHDVIPQLSGPNLEFIVPISPIPPPHSSPFLATVGQINSEHKEEESVRPTVRQVFIKVTMYSSSCPPTHSVSAFNGQCHEK